MAGNLFLSQTHFRHNRAFLVLLLAAVALGDSGRALSLEIMLEERDGQYIWCALIGDVLTSEEILEYLQWRAGGSLSVPTTTEIPTKEEDTVETEEVTLGGPVEETNEIDTGDWDMKSKETQGEILTILQALKSAAPKNISKQHRGKKGPPTEDVRNFIRLRILEWSPSDIAGKIGRNTNIIKNVAEITRDMYYDEAWDTIITYFEYPECGIGQLHKRYKKFCRENRFNGF